MANMDIAPLRNVASLNELHQRVTTRGPGRPGIAVFHGPSGWGKTTAAAWVAVRHACYHIEVRSCWRGKALTDGICRALGLRPARTIAGAVEQIGEELALSGRALMVDEADYLARASMMDLIRDIYEISGGAIILIGEEELPVRLRAMGKMHNRVYEWCAAAPASIEDAAHLARIIAPEIGIEPALMERITEASTGSLRRVILNLDRIRDQARRHGRDAMGLAEWGTNPFFTGKPPAPRRVA